MGHYVIIGGGGFLGAHIISTLQKNEFDRRIIVVDPTPRKFETVQVDEKLVTYWKGNKKLVHDFNVLGTEQLLEKCREHGVRRFIFASSVAVSFVGEPLYNVSEDEKLPDPRKYLNHYSASKAEAEQLVLSQSTEKFKTVCLRFRAIYGAEDPNVTEKVANLIRRGLFIGMMSVHGREPISAASSAVNCAQSFYLADQMLQQKGVLSKFDLAILATDNTYSIERARRELEYSPAPCQMPEAAEYYKKLKDVRNTPFFSQTFLIFLVVITLSIFLAFIFPQYK
uniref:3Beta_HSD domain-containing protein n=1 Tax=Caenorhabditis japonica TaxID=281687 RepID=A0A8R1HVL2_CAEJA